MPIYSFECVTHGVFDELVKMGQASAPCPECGVVTDKKRVSLVAPIGNSVTVTSNDVREELLGTSRNPNIGEMMTAADKLASDLGGGAEKIVRKITGMRW